MTTRATKGESKPATEATGNPQLVRLLRSAAKASGDVRIEYRDRIAAHGTDAIGAMEAWIAEGNSPGFAIIVIEAVGRAGESRPAITTLRRLRDQAPDWVSVIEPAIARIQATGDPTPRAASRRASGDPYMATGTPPPVLGPCEMGNRDGSACRNPGRYEVDGKLSCTTHYKAGTSKAAAS